jgi:hypothetical protein
VSARGVRVPLTSRLTGRPELFADARPRLAGLASRADRVEEIALDLRAAPRCTT